MNRLIGIFIASLMMFNSTAQIEYDELSLNTITTAVILYVNCIDSRSGAMGDVGVATSPDAKKFIGIHLN